ncbi:MAG TPA: SIS domain-containing protein [Mycobacteriales bacterium]|jgi:glucosamine--fructose-6-phosphate aminotransferase (isomerizing)|nr:SIS domain-containing protein [Mycobacteriales bacterium]
MTVLAAEVAEQAGRLATVLDRNAAEIRAVRREIRRRDRVRLLGIGSSRHVAAYGASCFDALSPVPATVLAAPGAGVPVPVLGRPDVVVVVSQSGRTPALVPVAASGRAAGALVVAVTNAAGSPLGRAADVVLDAGAGPERVVPATKSVTTSMLLLRALAGVSVVPGAVAAAVAAVVADDRLAEVARATELPDAVVASGFAAEAVADEVALKLAEVAAHLAVPEPIVDYLHGPAAVPGPVLALLDPDDPNSAALHGALTVGPSPAYDVELPATGDPTTDAVVRVVAGQCLALHWATARGLDPDDPRGLAKVTLTR